MISRRALLIALGSSMLIAAPSVSQQESKLRRIAFLYFGSRQSAMETGRYAAFIQGMRELGYQEGKQFILIARYADGDYGRLPGIAAELAAANPDIIVSTATATHNALRKVTASLPIVATTSVDPVRDGFAETLARPGRNFTGFSNLLPNISPKHIEFLKIALPSLSHIAVLWNPGSAAHPALLKEVEAAARSKSIRVTRVSASTPPEIDSAFATMVRGRAKALIILGDGLFVQQLRQIGEQALRHRLVSIYSTPEYAEFGGFMSYGVNVRDNYRRTATFIDKILRGTKPGDLPFEQPRKFELVVNRKTATALGLSIPQELLLRADKVIE